MEHPKSEIDSGDDTEICTLLPAAPEEVKGLLTNLGLKLASVRERGLQCVSVSHDLRLGSKTAAVHGQQN